MHLIIETKTGDNKLALIKYAIENKYQIKFFYTGEKVKDPNEPDYTKKGYRWVQPVALGRSPKPDASGNYNRLLLRGWQTGLGVTNTKKPEWKTFLVDEMDHIMVFDSSDSVWFKPFQEPDGYNLNTTGDKKFKGGKSLAHIDIATPPGPDRKKVFKKKPSKAKEVPTPADEPIQQPTASEPKKKVFKKKPSAPKMAANKKPKDVPAQGGPKEPIATPQDDNQIQKQIIPSKKGNVRKPEQEPGQEPDQNKQEPPVNPEDELKESFRTGREWLDKLI